MTVDSIIIAVKSVCFVCTALSFNTFIQGSGGWHDTRSSMMTCNHINLIISTLETITAPFIVQNTSATIIRNIFRTTIGSSTFMHFQLIHVCLYSAENVILIMHMFGVWDYLRVCLYVCLCAVLSDDRRFICQMFLTLLLMYVARSYLLLPVC